MDNKDENIQDIPEDNTGENLSENNTENIESTEISDGETYKTIHLSGMYENWFLDYASYVILERAVPDVLDGLKPVHRRILHAMKNIDDGRFNKVANIIGQTMQYHPHGDASIGDALVQLGQKDLLIETQGNWGNVLTGDSAAAARYIEARLSKFAMDVVFNPKTTIWKLSYDGRNKEPVNLPVKFPLLLTQGVEGIAVGLASKILPHNFNELIDASIKYLQEKDFEILPDFPTGGMADFTKYQEGIRGGKIKVRARINKIDKKTLSITEVPFGTTTSTLIESILQANEKGKIKIKKIDDNTAEKVEIIIHLASGTSPDQTIDALYAFTNCEMSISPNSCIIDDGKPRFIGVKEILEISTDSTVNLLKTELEIRKSELEEQWHFSSLEKIFIEKRIYRKIEECETWEDVISTIDKGLNPYKKLFKRDITRDDIIRLTEIKIKRISKYNSFKADGIIENIEAEIEEVQNHLEHLTEYAINYYKQIKKKYGKGKERKTEIRNFDTIEATAVAAANQKLYINREEGFTGTSLKRDEYVCECSDIDDIIVIREDGSYMVTKVSAKTFIGKNIIHIDVFKKNDERTIYNIIYRDGRNGSSFAKRFAVLGVTRDKEYDLTQSKTNSKITYFSVNPNGEAEVVKVLLRPRPKLKKKFLEYDFMELAIKGRGSKGNIVTKNSVQKINKLEEGISTLGAIDIWYDETVKRLNGEERGTYIGAFKSDDKIMTINQSGTLIIYGYDLSTHFEEDMIHIEKLDPDKIITIVYHNNVVNVNYIKRFQIEEGIKSIEFINPKTDTLLKYSLDHLPILEIILLKKTGKVTESININEFIGVKSYKAKGKKLSTFDTKVSKFLDPLPYEKPEDNEKEEGKNDEDVIIELVAIEESKTKEDINKPKKSKKGRKDSSKKKGIDGIEEIKQLKEEKKKSSGKKDEGSADNESIEPYPNEENPEQMELDF